MQSFTQQSSGHELTLRDILNVVFRHKGKIVVFFLCAVMLVSVATLLMPKTYESRAQIMLRLGRENATPDPTVSVGTMVNINESRENEINSEMEVIKSRELAEKVLAVMGIDKILNHASDSKKNKPLTALDSLKLRETAILAITKNLSTEVVKKTNVITVTFDSHDPKTAQDVITDLLGFYQEKHMAIFRPSGSYGFFEKQTDTLSAELINKEEGLRKLKNATGIASIEPQRENILSRISALKLELEQVSADLAAGRAKVKDMQGNLNNLPTIINEQKFSGTAQSSSDMLRTRLNELKLKRDELVTKYNDDSRPVLDIKKQIEETTALLDKEEFNNSRSTAAREIQMGLMAEQSDVSALSAKAQSVASALEAAQKELTVFNDNAVGLSRMQREHEISELNYRKYTDNLEQSRIDHELKAGNISSIAVIQPATFPVKALKPRKLYNLALGIFFGIFGGLCIAFVLEFLDHTLKSVDEIESFLRLPVLGVVPLFGKKKRNDSSQLSIDEPFDAIRRSLQSAGKSPPRFIGFTGCYAGEGASTVAANVSKSIASYNDAKVLLVDLNFEAPSLKSRLGLPYASGAAEKSVMKLPTPDHSALQVAPDVAPGVDVLPAGFKNLNPLKLGQSERFAAALAEGKKQYDYVIFDIPPMAQSPMAIEFAKFFDGVVMVVESGRVRRQVAQQAVEKMSRSGVTVFGVVMNKRKFYMPQWVYDRL